MVISLERGAHLHMAQLMPLPLTVSCFSKIQIGFTFLVLAHPGNPRQRAVKRLCVCFTFLRVKYISVSVSALPCKTNTEITSLHLNNAARYFANKTHQTFNSNLPS